MPDPQDPPDSQESIKQNYLRAHLEKHYGVRVMTLHPLDRGVFTVALDDHRQWIARVFPVTRAVEQVEGDAAILRFLEEHGFPAERCACVNPVSVLYGRSILVTNYIEGSIAEASDPTLRALGTLHGRLHRLPDTTEAAARVGGALHHYAHSSGGPQNDLIAAASWLASIEGAVPERSRARYESLREQVATADTCGGLPEALIHPDPVLKNVLATSNNELVLIDWTGSGRGPRIASLANLIWACALKPGGWSPRRVDQLVSAYREQVQIEDRELVRLATVMRIRPLVFACWRYRRTVVAGHPPDGHEWWWPSEELVEAIAARARAAFGHRSA